MQPPPPRWLLLLLALRLCSGASVPGESCGARFSASNCRATQDYIFVVDNSWSVADSHQTISSIMRSFIDSFEMDPGDDLSPRVGSGARCWKHPSATS